ncbi:MAG: polyhydroxybutyrate depolymerase [Actinomycetota bacterium]|nr:polyhydroxybutyrate depolymerase [Actinomycetota bacterium]
MAGAWATTRQTLLRACALGAIVGGFLLPTASPGPATSATRPGAAPPALAQPLALAPGPDAVPAYELQPGASPPRLTQAGAFLADYNLTIAGLSRSYRVFVPSGLVGPVPVVVALGGVATRADPDLYMQWRALARRKHFVVLEPRGHDFSWNAGRCCGSAARDGVDDVAAIAEMIRSAGHLYPLDPHRVYVVGFSNGGMMAYEYACRRPDAVAGIGVVAAAYMSPCRPRRGVPVMQVHGTADGVLPYAGGMSRLLGIPVPSTRSSDAVFGELDAATGVPVETVHLAGVDHAWPRPGWQGGYDTTSRLYTFLFAMHS